MKLFDVLMEFKAENPRCSDDHTLATRINAVNGDIYYEFLRYYKNATGQYDPVDYPEGLDRELPVPETFADLYIKYLRMEDAAATPTDPTYQDRRAAYYTRLSEYANYITRTLTAPKTELKT